MELMARARAEPERVDNFVEPDDHAVWVPARASLVRDDIHQIARPQVWK